MPCQRRVNYSFEYLWFLTCTYTNRTRKILTHECRLLCNEWKIIDFFFAYFSMHMYVFIDGMLFCVCVCLNKKKRNVVEKPPKTVLFTCTRLNVWIEWVIMLDIIVLIRYFHLQSYTKAVTLRYTIVRTTVVQI